MSITASWLVLAVVVLRLLLRKAPKAISCALWVLVALRLLLPFSFESVLSLVPSAETIPSDFTTAEKPEIDSGFYGVNNVINPIITETLANQGDTVEPPAKALTEDLAIVWAIGVVIMLAYMLASYLRVKAKVREGVALKDNVMMCDQVSSPFILGVIRPRIYLPSDISASDSEYVIAHERAHLARLDHLWKPLGFLLLSVHWFNPILWLAYVLLCRDIELACDERVIRKMGKEIKKPYSDALVNCSMPRRMIAACPLAFGEVGVKGRIKAVLNYKKPAFWVIIVAVVAVSVTAVCFLTDPADLPDILQNGDRTPPDRNATLDEALSKALYETIIDESKTANYKVNYTVADYSVLGVNDNMNTVTVYAVVMYREYNFADTAPTVEYETHLPTTVTFRKNGSDYALVTYKTPSENEKYPEGFPETLKADADPAAYMEKHGNTCHELANSHYRIIIEEPRYTAEIIKFYGDKENKVYETSISKGRPMHIMESVEDVDNYLNMFFLPIGMGADGTIDREVGKRELMSMFSARYDEEFYKDNVLLFIYIVSSSGGDQFAVESIYNDGERFVVNIVQLSHGMICSLGTKLAVIPVPRKDIESCTEFSTSSSMSRGHYEMYRPENSKPSTRTASFTLYVSESPVGEQRFDVNSLRIHGDYERKDGYLYLYSDNGLYTYVFKDLDGNRYQYDATKSNANWGEFDVEHGTIFVLG